MIKNMLIAASKMLEKSKDKNVKCAKTVIDEIIASLEPKELPADIPTYFDDFPKDQVTPKPGKKTPTHKHEEPIIGVKDGKLIEIKNVPLDGLVTLDGKKMTLGEAIGKSFQNIDILWRPS